MRPARFVIVTVAAIAAGLNAPFAEAQEARAGVGLLRGARGTESSSLVFAGYLQEKEAEPDQALINRARARAAGGNAMMFPAYATTRGPALRLEEQGQKLSWDDSIRVQIGPLGWVTASTLKVDPMRNYVFVNVGPYPLTFGEISIEKGEYVKLFDRKFEKGAQSLDNSRDPQGGTPRKKGRRPDRSQPANLGEKPPEAAGDSQKATRPGDRPVDFADLGSNKERPAISDIEILSSRVMPPSLKFSVTYKPGSAKVVVGPKAPATLNGTKLYVGLGPPGFVANVVRAMDKDLTSGSRVLALYANQGVQVGACLAAGLEEDRPGSLKANISFADAALRNPTDVPVSFFLVDESGAMSNQLQVWVDFKKGVITKGAAKSRRSRE